MEEICDVAESDNEDELKLFVISDLGTTTGLVATFVFILSSISPVGSMLPSMLTLKH